jgi:hypothetical protein
VADAGTRIVVNAGGLAPRGLRRRPSASWRRAGAGPAGRARRGRRPAPPRRRARPAAPRHGRAPDRLAADRQRLPRRLGHRRRAAGRARRWSSPGRVTDASLVVGPGGGALRLGPRRLGPPRRSGRRGPRPGVRHAGHRRQLLLSCARRSPSRCTWASRCRVGADGSPSSPSTTAPGGAVTVGTVTAQLLYEIAARCTPGRTFTDFRSPSRWSRGVRTGAAVRALAAAPRRAGSRSPEHCWAASATAWSSCDTAST